MKYVIKVSHVNGETQYINAMGRLGPLSDAFHYHKLSNAQIIVNLNTGRYADTTLEIVQV